MLNNSRYLAENADNIKIGIFLIGLQDAVLYNSQVAVHDRNQPMQMIYNFRDIGGCPTSDGARVKKGLLYRSGALSRATRADQQALVSAGIRTVIDLRSEEETQRDPDRLPEGVYIQYIQLPISVKSQGKLAYLSLLFSSLFRGGRRVVFS